MIHQEGYGCVENFIGYDTECDYKQFFESDAKNEKKRKRKIGNAGWGDIDML